jgi:hypothetical protein
MSKTTDVCIAKTEVLQYSNIMQAKPDHNWIDLLSPQLFWDVDRNQIDPEKHVKWLLERILERGKWEDWVVIRDNINLEKLIQEFRNLRITPKTHNFLERYIYAAHSASR